MDSTDFLAWWGAILSTLVVGREYWLSRDRIKVELIAGVRDFSEGPYVVLHIKNYSARPIMIEEVGLVWPWRDVTFVEKLKAVIKYRHRWRLIGWCYGQLPKAGEPYEIPKLVDAGHALDLWIPVEALDKDNLKHGSLLVGYARDALDRRYYSNSFKVHRPALGWRKKAEGSEPAERMSTDPKGLT